MPWEETEDYIRSGHRDPDDFVRLRTITIDEDQGIKAVGGPLKSDPGGPFVIQTFLFAKAKGWTMSKAKAWFQAHREEMDEQIGVVTPPAPDKWTTEPPERCYCRKCGYVLENPSEHCVDISCPECGAEHMYRHKSPTEDLSEAVHADFVKVLSDFIRIFGDVEGRRKFDEMVVSYGLDIEKPYSNQAQLKECWGEVCEAYNWAKPLIKYLREDDEAKYWKVRALTANVSMNKADYTNLEELERSARTLTWRPLNLNHDPRQMLPFPENRVDWAEFEDNAVECIIRIHNSQTEVQRAIEKGDIVNPSIEGEPRGGYRTKDGRKVPFWYNFTCLALLEKGVTLPGVPTTYGFEPLFLNESLGRSLAESLSMERDLEKESEMSQTEKGIKEYNKAAKDTPWELNRADYSLDQLKHASAVVTGDGETKADCRLPHHLPGDGKTHGGTLVWRGVAAAAVVLRGGRGGVRLGSEDRAKAMRHIAAHYREFDETAPWKEWSITEETKGIDGLDICGQCKFFTDLSDKTVTKSAVTGEATDAEVSISQGAIGPGVGRCSITEKLVRKNDSVCTDARPRERATDLDRTKENIGEMIMKDKINELEEKVLRAEQAKSREIEDHVKTKMDLTEATDKITRVTQELAVEQNKNIRIRENVRDLSGKLENALNRIPELEVRLEKSEGDLIFYKEAIKSAEEKFAVQKKDLAECKEELTRTLTKMNEESTKRATAVQEATNAEREKGRLSREVAELTERVSELTREVSDTALIRAESARSNLSNQKLIKELREKIEEMTNTIRSLKRRISKTPKEIIIE